MLTLKPVPVPVPSTYQPIGMKKGTGTVPLQVKQGKHRFTFFVGQTAL